MILIDAVHRLIAEGADVVTTDIVFTAVKTDRTDIVRVLLEAGADVHVYRGASLSCASRNGNAELVRLLLRHGADARTNDSAPLLWAASNGHTEVAQILLDAGSDIHTYDDMALKSAAQNGSVKLVQVLLAAGADITAGHHDAVVLAAERGHAAVVRLLLEAGSDATAQDYLALRRAVLHHWRDVIRLLLPQCDWNNSDAPLRDALVRVFDATPVEWCAVPAHAQGLPPAARIARRRWARRLWTWHDVARKTAWHPPTGPFPADPRNMDAWIATAGREWQRTWAARDRCLMQF